LIRSGTLKNYSLESMVKILYEKKSSNEHMTMNDNSVV
jgi:hypothetical protein